MATCASARPTLRSVRVCASSAKQSSPLPRTLQRSAAAAAAALFLSSAAPSLAFECGFKTACIPPPPNGEPRYIMPGSAYDPAKLAAERFKAKLQAAKQQDAQPAKAE